MIDVDRLTEYGDEVVNVLERAIAMYDLTFLVTPKIMFDLHGQCAGQAQIKKGRCILRFNPEAIEKEWDDMFHDTIPHEIAHLVCMKKPVLGKGHDAGWKRVAQSLGCNGKRTHTYDLSYAKKVTITRYVYELDDGTEVRIGRGRHKKIQDGYTGYFMRPSHTVSGQKQNMNKHHWVEREHIIRG